MDLNQLKTFVTVAEEEHLTRAAERLFTSQPAVSAQLKSLEDHLGVSLFDRTPKGMKLTPAGRQLLQKAQATIEAANALVSEAHSLEGKVLGNLEIGVNSDFPFLRIPQLLELCRDRYEGLQFSFINSMSAQIVPDIRKGILDSGFFFGPCNPMDLKVTRIADTPTAVVLPNQMSNSLVHASPEELAKQQWIYTTKQCPFYAIKEAIFSESPVKPLKNLFVDTEEGIRELIKANAGVSLLRLDDGLRAEREGWGKCWQGQTPSVELNIAIQSKRANEPLLKAWESAITQCWGANEGDLSIECTA